jgi:TP901 family phage tail tape measure protein
MMAEGVNLGSAYGTIEIGTEGAEASVQSLAATMRDAGAKMTAAFTLPLVGLGIAAFKTAGEFEQNMNIMAQVSGATADEMAGMQAQALELGAVTSFSAGEAADAMLELSKAGLNVSEVTAAVPGVLDLAAAGGMSLAQSAEVAANALNAFNLPAEQMPKVANLLAAAANSSSVEVSDLALSMKMAGAVFSSNGQSMDDMVTSIAMLGNAGIKGSDAGTSLKTMLLTLAAPTDKARGEIAKMGLSVYKADGSMRNFSDILNDLAYKTKGMSDEQRNLAFSTIFGSDAIRAATILSRDYSASWDDISDALGNQSAAADVANARMKGLGGAVEYFKGSLDSFLIETALPFLNSLGGIIRGAADALTAFNKLSPAIKNAALAFAVVLAAAGPLLMAISAIGSAVALLSNPVGWVILAVAGLAAAWAADFGGIQTKTAAVWAAMQPVFKAIGDWLGATLPGALDALQGAWATSFDAAAAAIDNVWQQIETIFLTMVGWLQKELPQAITVFKTAMAALFAPSLFSGFGLLLAAIKLLYIAWQDNLGGIQEKTAAFWATIQPTLAEWGVWLGVKLPLAMAWLQGVWASIWPGMLAAWNNVWPTIEAGLTAAKTWFDANLPGAIAVLQGAWTGAWPAMQTAFTVVWDALLAAFTTAQTWLNTNLPGALATLQTAWTGAWPAMQTAFTTAWDAILALFTTAQSWLNTNLPGALTTLQTAWTGAWPAMQTAFFTAFAGIGVAFGALGAFMQLYLPGAIAMLQEAWAGLVGAFSTGGVDMTGVFASIKAAWDGFVILFTPAMERVKLAFAGMATDMGPVGEALLRLGAAFQNLWVAVYPVLQQLGTILMVVFAGVGLFAVNIFANVLSSLADTVVIAIDQITATVNLLAGIITLATTGVQAVINGDWATVWEVARGLVQVFADYFRSTMTRFQTLVNTVWGNIYKAIIDTLTDMGVDVPAILDGIQAKWDEIWKGMIDALAPVNEALAAIKTAIQSFMDWLGSLVPPNPFQGIADGIQNAADAVANANPWKSGQTDGGGANAEGTSYAKAGLSLLNERGDEMRYLYPGEKVLTSGQTNRREADGATGRAVTINLGGVTLAQPMDVNLLALRLGDLIAVG